MGANLLGRNLDGNQIAREYRTCAGHADLLFGDGGIRQAGKCDCLLEFTSRPELALGAARESGHNSIYQNCLKVLLRATVRPRERDSSAISSGVAALKSAESTPVRRAAGQSSLTNGSCRGGGVNMSAPNGRRCCVSPSLEGPSESTWLIDLLGWAGEEDPSLQFNSILPSRPATCWLPPPVPPGGTPLGSLLVASSAIISETESGEYIPTASDSLKNKVTKAHCKVRDEQDQEKQQCECGTTRRTGGTRGGNSENKNDQDQGKDWDEQARRT